MPGLSQPVACSRSVHVLRIGSGAAIRVWRICSAGRSGGAEEHGVDRSKAVFPLWQSGHRQRTKMPLLRSQNAESSTGRELPAKEEPSLGAMGCGRGAFACLLQHRALGRWERLAACRSFDAIARLIFTAWLLVVSATPMATLGKALCLAVPSEFGKGLAILALTADCLALFLAFNPSAVDPGVERFPAESLANIASLIGQFLFLAFLVKLCERMKKPGLRQAAEQLFQRTLLIVFLPVAIPVVLVCVVPLLPFVIPALALIWIGVALGYLLLFVCVVIEYLQLLSALKNAILPG